MASRFSGTITAIATPFTADGSEVDYKSLAELVKFQLENGVSGLVVCGSTGEASTLSDAEYISVIRSVIELTAKKVPCIAGVNSNNTLRAVEMARAVSELGPDGLLVTCPAYNKPQQQGLFCHFQAVRKAVSVPIVAYNVPGRTAVNLLPQTLGRLADSGVIDAVKDSCGSLDQVLDAISIVKGRISYLSGDDSFGMSSVVSGGDGLVSVASNVVPREMSDMITKAMRGLTHEAAGLQMRLLPLMRALFVESNPVPVKFALWERKIISYPAVRAPLCQLEPASEDKVRSALRAGGFL